MFTCGAQWLGWRLRVFINIPPSLLFYSLSPPIATRSIARGVGHLQPVDDPHPDHGRQHRAARHRQRQQGEGRGGGDRLGAIDLRLLVVPCGKGGGRLTRRAPCLSALLMVAFLPLPPLSFHQASNVTAYSLDLPGVELLSYDLVNNFATSRCEVKSYWAY